MAQLSESELQDLMEVTFAQIDTNKNQRLEKSEVRAFEKQLHD